MLDFVQADGEFKPHRIYTDSPQHFHSLSTYNPRIAQGLPFRASLLAHPKKPAFLIANDDGSAVTQQQLRGRFDMAREAAGVAFQFRDIRAKAGTEASIARGMDHAQKLLGHKHVTMRQRYVRTRLGESVEPLRRPGIVEDGD